MLYIHCFLLCMIIILVCLIYNRKCLIVHEQSSSSSSRSPCGLLRHSTMATVDTGVLVVTRWHSDVSPDLAALSLSWSTRCPSQTLGFRPVERSVCLRCPSWCAGTSGLSRATWLNSDAICLDRISYSGVNPVVIRIASLVMWSHQGMFRSCQRQRMWKASRLLISTASSSHVSDVLGGWTIGHC